MKPATPFVPDRYRLVVVLDPEHQLTPPQRKELTTVLNAWCCGVLFVDRLQAPFPDVLLEVVGSEPQHQFSFSLRQCFVPLDAMPEGEESSLSMQGLQDLFLHIWPGKDYEKQGSTTAICAIMEVNRARDSPT